MYLSDQLLSTVVRESGILVDVHPGVLSQVGLGEQPLASSQLATSLLFLLIPAPRAGRALPQFRSPPLRPREPRPCRKNCTQYFRVLDAKLAGSGLAIPGGHDAVISEGGAHAAPCPLLALRGRAARAGARGPLPSGDSVIFKQILIGAGLMALAVIGRVGLHVAHILKGRRI